MDLLAFALYHEGDDKYGMHGQQHVIPPTEEEEDGEGTDGDEDGGDEGGEGGAGAGGRKRRKARGPEEEDEFGDAEDEEGSTRGRGAHSPATTDEEAEASSKRPRRGAQGQQQQGSGSGSSKGEARSELFVGRLSRALAAHADGVGLDGFLESVRAVACVCCGVGGRYDGGPKPLPDLPIPSTPTQTYPQTPQNPQPTQSQLNAELEGEGQRVFSAEEALAIVQAADEAGKLFWEENARVIYQ